MVKKQATSLESQIYEKYAGDISKIVKVLEGLQTKKKSTKKRSYGELLVDLQAVSKQYKVGRQEIKALDNVSLQIQQGEYVALTGPSGSGKSTLLQLIGALDKPSDGTILINDADIAKLSDRALSVFRNRTIGFVFQFFYLQPFLSLEKNIEVAGMFARTKRSVRQEQSKKLAEEVGLSDRLSHLPNELSGGQMQRAAIARALLNGPKILLADEPTGNLDRENAFAIMDLFDQVREQFGTTVIVVTHDAELAARADREVKLRDGRLMS